MKMEMKHLLSLTLIVAVLPNIVHAVSDTESFTELQVLCHIRMQVALKSVEMFLLIPDPGCEKQTSLRRTLSLLVAFLTPQSLSLTTMLRVPAD